jgi:hypothetical protein
MRKIRANGLRVGDVIMPPAREVQLWMRRVLQERNLAETALYLTITDIQEGTPDKRGRWLLVTTNQTDEWNGDRAKPLPFKFKVRPETPWAIL